jgi:glycosyltransferase involved in cell wall biosynthesis
MPKVSVIIPTHNRAKILPLAVKSVLHQTFQDFEIIIVDDASQDNTEEVIRGFRDNRIKYFRREMSGGDAVARNLGIVNSEGEYLAFLDDDDEWFPKKLQRQVTLIESSQPVVGGVYTGQVNIDGTNGKILSIRLGDKKGNLFNELLGGFRFSTSSVMVKKECFHQIGLFDENIPYNSDFDMWVRISKNFQFECIEEPLTKYYIHATKLSTNFDLVIKGQEMVGEKYKHWYKLNPKSYSRKYLEIGILYCLNGHSRKGRRAYLKSITLSPFWMKPYLIFFLSCLGTNIFRKVNEIRNSRPI